VVALLDPEPITHGANDADRFIKSPPTYRLKDTVNGTGRSPEKRSLDGRRSTRGRTQRSESPSAGGKKTPARKFATPRRPRKTRGGLASVDEHASAEPEALTVNGGDLPDTVQVKAETTTRPAETGDGEVEITKARVSMPSGHPDLPLPDDTQAMLETARRMVKEARKLEPSTSNKKGKRKAEEMLEDDDDDDDEEAGDGPAARPMAKRARKMEVALRKETIKRKTYTGIFLGLAVGCVLLPPFKFPITLYAVY